MMKKNIIGKTNLSLTELGIGTAPIGGWPNFVENQKVEEALEESWNGGVRYFDTAPLYGSGMSEERLGNFLKTQKREEAIIATKVGRLIVDVDKSLASSIKTTSNFGDLSNLINSVIMSAKSIKL